MSISLAVLAGVLFAVGLYLMTHRSLTRIVVGIALLGNGVNLLVLVTGGPPGDAPILGRTEGPGPFSDSVPQALVLTSIVIGFALVSFLLALAWRSWTIRGTDDVEDDFEDRRVALDHHVEDPGGHGEPFDHSDTGDTGGTGPGISEMTR